MMNMNKTVLARETGAVAVRAQDLLRAVEQVSQYSARTVARAAARRRARELRDLARDLKRCGETIDRLGLTGADRLREDVARFLALALDVEAALRARV